MRIVRIVSWVVLAVVVLYAFVVQNANPNLVALPGLLSLPLWLVLTLVALIAFLAGWIPSTIRAWRRGRDRAQLERRVAELEAHLPSYDRDPGTTVIPDRIPAVADPHRLEDTDDDPSRRRDAGPDRNDARTRDA